MKKLLLLTAFFCGVYQVALIRPILAQADTEKPTAEELKAAREISSRFVQRITETGDIEPLIKEMFVADFMRRYVKERKIEERKIETSKDRETHTLFAPGTEYDTVLLDKATDEDWRRFYIATFNFMQYGFTYVFNSETKSLAAGKKEDDIDLERLTSDMYPPTVIELFGTDPVLRNFVRKQGPPRPIRTVEELRNVNSLLEKALKILYTGSAAVNGKLSETSKIVLKKLIENPDKDSDPSLEVCDDECYGFAKGTRMLNVYAVPSYILLIAKVGSDYKVIFAFHGSPD